MAVPRSPFDQVGGLYYVGRMFDKIRLFAAGTLQEDLHENLGTGFDAKVLAFLQLEYAPIVERVKAGGSDEEILEWCYEQGRKPSEFDMDVWNEYMRKRGWNDTGTKRLRERLAEMGAADRTDIVVTFDYIDLDEGRDPRDTPRSFA
jgi:hypothetical protein